MPKHYNEVETDNTSTDVESQSNIIYKDSEEVQFTDSSTGADNVLWDFGDGTTSEERNPLHYYYENGEYTVILTATNQFGQSSQEQTVIVSGIGIEFYEVDEEEIEDEVEETEDEVEEIEDEEEEEGEGRPPTEETPVLLTGRLYQFGMNQSEGLTITNLNYPTLISEIEASRQLNVENQGSYFITSINESRLNLATIVQGMTMGSFVNFNITVLTTQSIDDLEEETYNEIPPTEEDEEETEGGGIPPRPADDEEDDDFIPTDTGYGRP